MANFKSRFYGWEVGDLKKVYVLSILNTSGKLRKKTPMDVWTLKYIVSLTILFHKFPQEDQASQDHQVCQVLLDLKGCQDLRDPLEMTADLDLGWVVFVIHYHIYLHFAIHEHWICTKAILINVISIINHSVAWCSYMSL